MSIDDNGRSDPADNLPAASETDPHQQPFRDLAGQERRSYRERLRHRLLAEADRLMQTRTRHPDGGRRTVAQTLADEKAQAKKISEEIRDGSRKHDRQPRSQRRIPGFVLVLDIALLLYFFAGITDVHWRNLLSMNMAYATTLAVMVAVPAYSFLAFAGHQLRARKGHDGAVHFSELDAVDRLTLGVAVGLIAALAVLMFLHVHGEVIDNLGPKAEVTALVISLAVSAVSVIANYLVVMIHALDGSDETDRLTKLTAATRRPVRKMERLQRRAAQIDP